MSVGNSQKEEKRKRRPTQFQNPKFGDFFLFVFSKRFVLSKRDLVTSRNWCADSESLSLPHPAARRRERCEHSKAGQSYRREREGTLVPLLSRRSERPLTAAFCSWRGSAIPLKGVSRCARNGHKNDAGAFCPYARGLGIVGPRTRRR